MRTLSHNLLPPVLDELGLGAALQELAARHAEDGLDRARSTCTHEEVADPQVAAAAYGIVGEALVNVARHSGASECTVRTTTATGSLERHGLRPGARHRRPTRRAGVGSRSMRERAEEQGGRLEIHSAPGSGTTVEAVLPLEVREPCLSRSGSRSSTTTRSSGSGWPACSARSTASTVVAQAADAAQALAIAPGSVDVVLMDLHLGEDSGIETTRELVRRDPGVRVLVVTMREDDESVVACMRVGARGYLLKGASPEEVERAVRAVANGEVILGPAVAARAVAALTSGRTSARVPFPELTDREREVLDLVARGYDNLTIARRMVLSPKTVRNHVSNVLTKLGVPDRSAAIVRAREGGLGVD